MPREPSPQQERQQPGRGIWSSLTSLLPPPGNPASNSFSKNQEQHRANDHVPTANIRTVEETRKSSTRLYSCFNPFTCARGHLYSTRELFDRGVWIGYLDKQRHNDSFRGLPSFHALKKNYSKFSAPQPPCINGIACEERLAICRGCARPDSFAIPLTEVQFVNKTKLVIMTLDGDDNVGTFYILVPHQNNRSLKGLQAYRPYEITGEGGGTTFDNNFMLLTLRNPSRDAGTLKTVLDVLGANELSGIQRQMATRSTVDLPISSLLTIADDSTSTLRSVTVSAPDVSTVSDSDTYTLPIAMMARSRKRRKLVATDSHQLAIAKRASRNTDVDCSEATQTVQSSTLAEMQRALGTSGRPINALQDQDFVRMETTPLDLSESQAKRIHFIWTFNDNGTECELIHTLHECKTFEGLLKLLQEDSFAFPSAAGTLTATRMWHFMYPVQRGKKKAVVSRTGTETVFNRLQATLAQLPIWIPEQFRTIDIEMKALSIL